jgi:DNA-binding transcriptional LysR family regulator
MGVLRLSLRQLQIFEAVARCGSTQAAGAEIALSQSATSAAVNELERLLSLQLFDRVGKRLLLNDNGRALLPRAQAMLEGAADIERLAHGADAQLQFLRVGASTTIGTYVLPALWLAALGPQASRAEAWRSRAVIGNTAEICQAVARFELDVGLIEGPHHDPALAVTPWLQDELVIVAAPGHALARAQAVSSGQRVSVRSLRSELWLLREPGSGTREATDEALLPRLHGYVRSLELGSSEAIKHAAATGIGVACLSSWAVADWLDAGRLVRLRTTLPTLTRQCHIVLHRHKHMTPALAALLAGVRSSPGPAASDDRCQWVSP